MTIETIANFLINSNWAPNAARNFESFNAQIDFTTLEFVGKHAHQANGIIQIFKDAELIGNNLSDNRAVIRRFSPHSSVTQVPLKALLAPNRRDPYKGIYHTPLQSPNYGVYTFSNACAATFIGAHNLFPGLELFCWMPNDKQAKTLKSKYANQNTHCRLLIGKGPNTSIGIIGPNKPLDPFKNIFNFEAISNHVTFGDKEIDFVKDINNFSDDAANREIDLSKIHLFDGVSAHITTGPESPIMIANNNFYELLKKHITLNSPSSIRAVEIRKVKKDFRLVTISLKTYLSNPHKYIVGLSLPKILTVHYALNDSILLNYSFYNDIPTVIIPNTLINNATLEPIAKEFFKAIATSNLLMYLEKDFYEERKKQLPLICKNWDGILRLLNDNTSPEKINTELAGYLGKVPNPSIDRVTTKLLKNSETKNYLLKNKKAEDLLKEANAKQIEISDLTRSAEAENLAKINLELKLKAAIKQVELYNTALTQTQDVKNKIHKDLDILNSTLLEDKTKVDKIIASIFETNNSEAETTSETLSLTSIVFHHITSSGIRRTYNNLSINLETNRLQELTQTLLDPEWSILAISFTTQNPIAIYVDAAEKRIEDCKIVLGGPYIIQISKEIIKNNLIGTIWLNGADAMFGIKAISANMYQLKQHPHSAPITVAKGDLLSFKNHFLLAPSKMCLGEVEKELITAIANRDLLQIKILVYRWISSAWSKDQWGKEWDWFPQK